MDLSSDIMFIFVLCVCQVISLDGRGQGMFMQYAELCGHGFVK